MKVARFSHAGAINFGIIDESDLVVLDGDPLYAGFDTTGERVALADAALLAPSIPRSKIVGALAGSAAETPVVFLKPNTSVVGPGDKVNLPAQSSDVHAGGTVALIIGAVAKNVRAGDADSVIFGYSLANDVTARDLVLADGQVTRGKSFDTFCPLGPVIETEFDPTSRVAETRVNGEVRQTLALDDLRATAARLIEHASSIFTLLPGDLILLPSDPAEARISSGDVVEVEVPGLGILRNTVA